MTNRFPFGAICLLLAPAAVLAGCTTSASPSASQVPASAHPRMAVYSCGEDGVIRIENLGSIVRVYTPAEPAKPGVGDSETAAPAPVELAAAPPGQRSRYGIDGYALVLEGREALWMKAGKAPLTCMR